MNIKHEQLQPKVEGAPRYQIPFIPTEFQKARKAYYCKVPKVAHTAIEVPAAENFEAKRRRLQEVVLAPVERRTNRTNGPQVGEAVALAVAVASSEDLPQPQVNLVAVGRERLELLGYRTTAVGGLGARNLSQESLVASAWDPSGISKRP